MSSKVLSIEIGTKITKICEVSYNKYAKNSGIKVHNSISFTNPVNVVEDGLIKEKEIYAQALRTQIEAAKFTTKKVIFSIASTKIAIREITIPPVKDDKIMNLVKTGASEYFPVDLKEYILSYIIMEKKTSDQQKNWLGEIEQIKTMIGNTSKEIRSFVKDLFSIKQLIDDEVVKPEESNETDELGNKPEDSSKTKQFIRLNVYAVPANLVKNYYRFAEMVGLEIVSMDYHGNSNYQILKTQEKEGTNVFVQLNERDTIVSILDKDMLVLQRSVAYGISSLVDIIKEQKGLKIETDYDALRLLESSNLLDMSNNIFPFHSSPDLEEIAVTNEPAMEDINYSDSFYEVKRNIVESLNFLTNSITRMLEYNKSNNKNVIYQNIYLSGFGTRIQGIEHLFSSSIGINNNNLDKINMVKASKKAQSFMLHPSEYMACVGAVLNPVGFIPMELVEHKQKIQTVVATTTLIILGIFGSALLSYTSFYDYMSAKRDYKITHEQLVQMPPSSGIKDKYTNTTQQLDDLSKMEATMQGKSDILTLLSQLESKLLTKSYIQSLQFSETGIVMNVIIADNQYGANALTAKLLMQLKSIDLFSDVQDSNMAVSEDGQVSLTVTCTYK
jgi:Tfp pilus assembly protein, ATPase PilM